MAEKRYYWLKLHKDFFKRHEIRIIEDMPNGKDYILFYLKLLVESVTHEGALRFSDAIPYNEQMLATITNTNVDIVKAAMQIFIELHMIELLDDQTIFMAEVEEMIGSETDAAVKKRLQRAKKNEKEDIVPTLSRHCPTENRDKSIENRDKDIKNILNVWNELPEPIPKIQSIRGTRATMLKSRIAEYGNDKVLVAIDNINNSTFLKGKNDRGWVINFDWFIRPNNFVKVLENNYVDKQKPNKLKNKPSFDIEEIKRKTELNDDWDI